MSVHDFRRYREEPLAFIDEILGVHLYSKQREIVEAVFEHERTGGQVGQRDREDGRGSSGGALLARRRPRRGPTRRSRTRLAFSIIAVLATSLENPGLTREDARSHGGLTVADLLNAPELGLTLVAGGNGLDGLRGRVLGAHSIEVEHPSRWLDPHWVMLTTGILLRGRPDAQRALIGELQGAKISALGFALDVTFKQVPRALVDAADERGLPLVSVPHVTGFSEIIGWVQRSLLSSELRAYHRLSSLQRYLMDSLALPDPEGVIVRRLSEFLNADVVLFSALGEIEKGRSRLRAAQIWEELTKEPQRPISLIEVEKWHAVVAEVASPNGGARRWLVVSAEAHDSIASFGKAAIRLAVPLIAAASQMLRSQALQRRAMRRALLEEALCVEGGSSTRDIAARAETFGIDFSADARIVMAVDDCMTVGNDHADDGLARMEAALESALDHQGMPYLITRRRRAVVALIEGDCAVLLERLHALVDRNSSFRMGVGRPVHRLADVRHSFRDAQLALNRGIGVTGDRVIDCADLDIPTLLLADVDLDRLRPTLQRVLGTMQANMLWYEALDAYLRHDQDIASAAASIHLHPNSLRYRLRRLEEALGSSLRDPSTIATLHIALLARNLIESDPTAGCSRHGGDQVLAHKTQVDSHPL